MTVREEVSRKIGRDALLARLRRKIDSGKGTYADSFAYSDRAGKLLGEVFSRRLPDIPPEERETLCVKLLHDRYTDINSVTDSVQKAQDAAQGLHLAPQHAPFNNERAHQIGSATADQTVPVETQQRRAKSATATMTRAMHDDRMKTEASFRSRAGLKCYITRMTDGKCCPWCSKVAGRYEYGREPDGIYRRHDNCSCTVTFENGRKRQDVWSKRVWEAPKEGAGAGELTVLSEEQTDYFVFLDKLKRAFSGKTYQKTVIEFTDSLRGNENTNTSVLLRRALKTASFGESDRPVSYYSKESGVIYLVKGAPLSTVAHELFHKIDSDNEISISGLLTECIRIDYERLVNLAESSGQTLEDMLYLSYRDAFRRPSKLISDYRGISDIIDGMTNGKTWLGFGHSKTKEDYWGKPFKLEKETFAQYGRMYYEAHPEVLKMAQELFPNTTAQIDLIISALIGVGR